MRLTHYKTPVCREKLVVHPIKRKWNMTTSINVGMQPALMIDHEALLIRTADSHDEFERLAGRDFADAADDIARGVAAALTFHVIRELEVLLAAVCQRIRDL